MEDALLRLAEKSKICNFREDRVEWADAYEES